MELKQKRLEQFALVKQVLLVSLDKQQEKLQKQGKKREEKKIEKRKDKEWSAIAALRYSLNIDPDSWGTDWFLQNWMGSICVQ